MKFLPPAVALLVLGTWLGLQHHSITQVENENTVLRGRIGAAGRDEAGRNADSSPAHGPDRRTVVLDGQPLDWKRIAHRFVDGSAHFPQADRRTWVALKRRIMMMEDHELTAALDDLAGQEIAPEVHRTLESMLLYHLVLNNPRLALEHYNERIDDLVGENVPLLRDALTRCAREKPPTAEAWLDRQIANGAFVSKSLGNRDFFQHFFEGGLLTALIASDPAAASRRLSTIPEDRRSGLFQNGADLGQLEPKDHPKLAALVRELIPEDDHLTVLLQPASFLRHERDGRAKTRDYLDAIKATAPERRLIASEFVEFTRQDSEPFRNLERPAIDDLHKWLATVAPADADAILGEQLGKLSGTDVRFEDKAAMVSALHAETDSDELLVAFLAADFPADHQEQGLSMLDKISEEKRREQLRQNLHALGKLGNENERHLPAYE